MVTREILNSHPLSTLKKEISKTNIKGYSKMKKAEVVDLMMKNKNRFGHIQHANKKQREAKTKDVKPQAPKKKINVVRTKEGKSNLEALSKLIGGSDISKRVAKTKDVKPKAPKKKINVVSTKQGKSNLDFLSEAISKSDISKRVAKTKDVKPKPKKKEEPVSLGQSLTGLTKAEMLKLDPAELFGKLPTLAKLNILDPKTTGIKVGEKSYVGDLFRGDYFVYKSITQPTFYLAQGRKKNGDYIFVKANKYGDIDEDAAKTKTGKIKTYIVKSEVLKKVLKGGLSKEEHKKIFKGNSGPLRSYVLSFKLVGKMKHYHADGEDKMFNKEYTGGTLANKGLTRYLENYFRETKGKSFFSKARNVNIELTFPFAGFKGKNGQPFALPIKMRVKMYVYGGEDGQYIQANEVELKDSAYNATFEKWFYGKHPQGDSMYFVYPTPENPMSKKLSEGIEYATRKQLESRPRYIFS
jgi:hypothetical protein